MGHVVDLAEDGLQAITKFQQKSYDLILMDVRMPTVDGLEATRRVREMEGSTGRHTPIIAMTAQALTGDRERCIEAGMDAYISKPLSKSALADVIESTLATQTASTTRSSSQMV
jgi:two-component system sensor histidine kinase/response regulator